MRTLELGNSYRNLLIESMSKEVTLHKIKHQLDSPSNQLEFLLNLEESQLELLLDQINQRLESDQSDLWEKLAKVSKFMPAFITAKVSETVMGEVVCANVAVHMQVKDALKVLNHLSINFLAKVSKHLNPSKCIELINSIPMNTVKKVNTALLKDKEYYTLAGFVDVLELKKVLDVIDIIKEEIDLLEISTYVQQKSLIAKIVNKLPDRRISKLITAAYDNNFQDEIFKVFDELSSDHMHRILRIAQNLSGKRKDIIISDLNKRFF